MKKNSLVIDITKPRSQRPMVGLDVEDWRSELGLSKYDAQYALGFRNSNHYNRICLEPQLPVVLELLIRIYEESPVVPGWDRFTLKELYQLMYGDVEKMFAGTKHETFAKVDLGKRFTKIFDRSPARQYQWLGDEVGRNELEPNAYSVIECILSKLKQVDDPKEVLERLARRVWLLRGVDLDAEYRVPSLDLPPTRQKTGRKSKALVPRKPESGRATVKAAAARVKMAPREPVKSAAAKAASKSTGKKKVLPKVVEPAKTKPRAKGAKSGA